MIRIKKSPQTALFFYVSFLFLLVACADDAEPSPSAQEQVLKKLTTAGWQLNNVKVNGTDQSDLFINFTITFGDKTYTTSNGEPVWPSSGTWSFADANTTTQITRSDGVQLVLQELTDTSLKISLQWSKTTFEEGRTKSISGQHIFELSK